ncbi:MAG TPA: DNA polymerase/3'-5' exonuclease PolX [bacterium]|nr:DNA polymerase/3'-5' exonuclease PolX [bacterium]
MDRESVIAILDEIAILLELKGENPFKSRAYSNAARALEADGRDISQLVVSGELGKVNGIGAGLTEKITELVQTGKLAYYLQLKSEIPDGVLEILRVPGMGPKKVRAVYTELGVDSLGSLEYACRENRLVTLPGFGSKTQQKVLEGIERLKKFRERHLLDTALIDAGKLADYIRQSPNATRVEIAGSLRRRRETIKDVDILVTAVNPEAVMNHFVAYPEVETVTGHGETKSSIVLNTGINADLRVVRQDQFAYALHHFTGSREHNTEMRSRARKMGLKMNEYGLFKDDEQPIECADEQSLFQELGLQYIPPELRENTGEIEAAERGEIPTLIEPGDVRGIFHVHSNYSDGSMTLERIAAIGRSLGYEYVGIADHSQSARYAHGLEPERVIEQHREIDEVNKGADGFRLLKGIESDILKDGSLDYSDDILEQFDFVIASVHSNFNLSEREMTERILKALRNPFVTMLGHPTGRLLLAREPYPVDLEAVLECAAENGVAVEINANPHRLDLDWIHCKRAKALGVRIAICPDAHDEEGFEDTAYGVAVARRGWLERSDIINTMALTEVTAWLQRQRSAKTTR